MEMNRWLLVSLATQSSDTYLATYRDSEAILEVSFIVEEINGIVVAKPTPDIFMTGQAIARQTTAAVTAFHAAVHAQRSWQQS
jgi:hypothetical protein